MMGNKVCIDGIWYELNKENKTASVTYSDKKYQGEIIIPDVVVYEEEEYVVIEIGWLTFGGCSGLTSINISKNVTKIEDWAFEGCSGLTSIIIPKSVKVIGSNAFKDCGKLKSIAIPKSVKEVGSEAFTDTAWYINQPDGVIYTGKVLYKYKGIMPENSSIEIKDCTINIGYGAFRDCTGLTSIIIPESVKNIEGCAFEGCSSLTSIIIPKSVKVIGSCAFKDCGKLKSIAIPKSVKEVGNEAFTDTAWYINQPDGVMYIGKVLYKYKGEIPENSTIEINDVTICIGYGAFRNSSGLTSIVIPKSIEDIKGCAFDGCNELASITIPENVKKIAVGAFKKCSALKSILVAENNEIYDSRNNCNAIIETKSNTLIVGCSTTIIPESVTKIGRFAFGGCNELTSITIPENVKKIDVLAFARCSALKSIIVAENNEIYDSRNNCNAIIETNSNTLIIGCSTTIIPESVTKIGGFAFDGCNGITSITIPDCVTEISPYAFRGCSNLKDIYCYNFVKKWRGAFDKSLVGDITLHVPKKVLGEDGFFVECSQCLRKSTCVLNGFKKIVPIEAKVKKIELPSKILLSEKSVHLLDQTITPSYATEQSLKWESSNEEVAVVNSKGRVVALSSGTATITAMATDGSEVCASCEIMVRRMVENIQLSNTSISLVVGNAFSLNAIVTPKDAYDTSLTWSTTDDDIAMILGNGRIVAVSAGTAIITAKANDGSEVSATCEVVVTENKGS